MQTVLTAPELGVTEFRRVAEIVYSVCGITLPSGKEGLVRSRLSKRLRHLQLATFAEYLSHVERDGAKGELAEMIDAITTNKTNFFREPAHFAYLRDAVLPEFESQAEIRIWSAGCSTGEEPYTIRMVLRDALGDGPRPAVKILATDISARVLTRARQGVYTEEAMAGVPGDVIARHFTAVRQTPGRAWQVNERVRDGIRFARLNLMGDWPMRGPFDVIFCRNVMIYFDRPTQQKLVRRYRELLAPGGHLFVGHSESLTSFEHGFEYVQPAVYRNP
jgi:chemotaxis protein methyltransferase CheR